MAIQVTEVFRMVEQGRKVIENGQIPWRVIVFFIP